MRARRRFRQVLSGPKTPSRVRGDQFRSGWRSHLVVVLIALGAGIVLTSPTGGLLVLGYGCAGLRAVAQRAAERVRQQRRDDALDELQANVAQIRAGAQARPLQVSDPQLHWQAGAVHRLAARTGAPLADLLDRVVHQEREMRRLAAADRAQAAGIRLTAVLLVGLPAAALLLGQSAGLQPFSVLLHSVWGAGLAGAGGLLQAAGWWWTERIARAEHGLRHARRTARRKAHRDAGRTGSAGLPLGIDLIAGVLGAGLPVDAAVLAVGAALPDSLGSRLIRVGRALRCGAPAAHAWQHLAGLPAARRIATAATLSASSGAALAAALTQCAADLRAEAQIRQQERAHRAAVLLVLPLGSCFLPAFMLVGLVPMILAVLAEVL